MFFQYGTFIHPIDEVALVDVSIQPILGRRGLRTVLRTIWQLRGVLIPSTATASAITAAANTLRTAYGVDGKDAGLFENNGTRTTHFLDSSRTLGGVKVSNFSFPDGVGAAYVTHLRFSFVLTADIPDVGANLIFFKESLSFSGDTGPIRKWVIPVSGESARRQIVSPRSMQRITQSGQAVGFVSRPSQPPPPWPQLLHGNMSRRNTETPEVNAGSATDYAIQWSYEFESPRDLSGENPRTR